MAGPVYFDVGLSYALEWNDNIRISSGQPEADFIHRPQVDVRAIWPVTEDSVLSFGMGIGYEKYMDNSDLDGLLITPNSELAWDISVKDFMFTLYDRCNYSREVASEGGLSGTGRFPRLENTAGVRARWSPDRREVEFGYSHYNFFSTTSTYDYLTRSAEQFFGRAAWRFAEVTKVGVEASGSLTDYDSSERTDNQNVSVGPFLEWMVIEDLRLSLRGGYVFYFGEDLVTGEDQDFDSYYLGFYANHRLTDFLTHTLSLTRDVQQSVDRGSTLTEQLGVSYGLTWAFHRSARLSANGFYEHGQQGVVLNRETYDRFGFGVGVRWELLKQLSTGLDYRYTTRDSNVPSRGYDQNVVTLTASYQF
jgi:hypothetical protein